MQVSRVVKVSVNDADSIWSDLSKMIFSDFIVRIPGQLSSHEFREDGANVLPAFVPESKDLLQYAQIGSDPYERPYLYIYVIKVKSSADLKEATIHRIQHWVAEASMIGTQWRVFIIQEESSFFDSKKQINVSELVSEPSQQRNIIVIQCRKKLKLTDQNAEIIRSTIYFALIESFDAFEAEGQRKIDRMRLGSSNILLEKLRAWHALLLLYYGFTEEALEEFISTYKNVAPSVSDIFTSQITPIETEYITNYPSFDMEDYYSVMNFALHGAMAVTYTKTRFVELIDLFLMHYAFLAEKCEARKQTLIVEQWAEESIKKLLSMPDFSSSIDVVAVLLERLFYLQIQKNSSEASVTRARLLAALPSSMKYSRAAVDTRFMKWAELHKMPFPSFHDSTSMWRSGAKAACILLEDAIAKKIPIDVEKYAAVLLNDRAAFDDKTELMKRLSKLSFPIKLTNPFDIKPRIESHSFGGLVQQGTAVDITIRLMIPQWLKQGITNFKIIMSHESGSTLCEEIEKPDLSKKMIVRMFFMDIGMWKTTKITWKVGSVEMDFPIDDFFAKLNIVPLESPKIDMQLPLLASLWKSMKINVTADFSQVLEKDISMNVAFADSNVNIPSQKGKAYLDDEQVTYSIDEKGNMLFIDSETEDDVVLSQHVLKFQLDFQMKKQTNTTFIIASTKIGKLSFEQRNHVSFEFPIECKIRLQTDEFIHICLHNTSDIDLTIESAEIMPDAWGRMELKAGKSIFLLARHVPQTESILNVFVSEPHGSSIANSWNLREQAIGCPMIEATLEDEVIVEGEMSSLTIELPEGTYKLHESKDIIFAGCLSGRSNGGETKFTFIPLHQGNLKLPEITINNVMHRLNPMFITVEKTDVPLMTPLISNQDPPVSCF